MPENTATRKIIVIDDDREMRDSLLHLLEAANWQVEVFAKAEAALDQLDVICPDVVLSDVRMPGMDGMTLLKNIATNKDNPPVVLITAHGDIPMAVEAIQAGAYGFIEKPFEPRRLLMVLGHAADQHRLSADTERLKERLARLSGLDRILIGESSEIKTLREDILSLSDINPPVMILGETGTGKELVARALHDLSPRANGPFVAINCATIPADHFESTMFGESGQQRGLLAGADGGTLFLDEIGACPIPLQAKLLRMIETQEYTPVGGDKPLPVSIRILSASNENLEAAVNEGNFRSDLLYRLNTLVINLPTLRERRSDIALLLSHFMEEFSRIYEVQIPDLTTEDMSALMSHEWPGNVRELRHVAERRLLAARRGRGSVSEAIHPDQQDSGDVPDTLREAVAAFERELISKAIKTHQGKMDAVAEALGIGRRTLNDKIVKLGLNKDELL
jgi:two-component system C4-dicarboxylate transport response regulator DctD